MNAEGTRLVADSAIRMGCARFLYMSTAAVYALEGRVVVDEETPCGETVPRST